jgi:flagellar biosynthetic protein FliR
MEYYVLQLILLIIIFVRVFTVFSFAPVFNDESIPVQIRLAIAIFFSFTLFPLLKDQMPHINLNFLSFVLLVVIEVVVGAMIGFMINLIFLGMQIAGELMGFDLGLNVATVYNPETGNNPVLGQFLYYISIFIFLLINGHHFIIDSIKISYESVPISGFVLSNDLVEKVIKTSSIIFIVAIKIAAPIIISLFLTNIALGILARVVPQMNIFIVGFPLKIGIGLLIISFMIPFIFVIFKKLLYTFEFSIVELIRVM